MVSIEQGEGISLVGGCILFVWKERMKQGLIRNVDILPLKEEMLVTRARNAVLRLSLELEKVWKGAVKKYFYAKKAKEKRCEKREREGWVKGAKRSPKRAYRTLNNTVVHTSTWFLSVSIPQ